MNKLSVIAIICAVAAITVALSALQISQTASEQSQDETAELAKQIAELDQRLLDIGDLQHVLLDDIERRSQKTVKKDAADRKRTDSQLDDRVTNQRRANDNQWQQIDTLTSQQMFNKKLIDQINFDLVKIQREIRDLGNRASRTNVRR